MAGSGVSAGHETTAIYQWEDSSFNETADGSEIDNATNITFGANVQVNTTEGSNAIRRVFRPGKRIAIDELAMFFEGSFSVQFTLTNPWWMRQFLGSPSQSGSGPTYTYDYTGTSPDSFRIVEGHEQSGKERVITGCVSTRATIDASVPEEVTVTIEGLYADETLNNPSSITSQATKSYDPMTFAEGTFKVSGTTENYVQTATVTIANNVDGIREMGSRIIVDYNPKTLEPSVDFGKIFEGDHTSLERMYGGTGDTSPQEDADDNQVECKLKFDNGKGGGSGQNKGTFTITGSLADAYDETGMGDPRADLEETINRVGQDVNLSWTNEESSAP